MNIKTIASAIALSSAMLLGGSAYAETMIGSTTVMEADLPAVQQRCDQLALASDTSATESDAMGTDSTAGGSAANVEDAEEVNELEQVTTTIDLDTVTLEQCQEAGLIAE
ncbi:hypothetical protein PSQ19_07435 [Devosia algicola]|uniref:Uncharacterized protein n=1 Tax=Devosia algicola TaxID=3026418 RepID=A0ABY7YR95_9HYPH|nr:hypothetical protein [Devosia algicola]WDR03858.1 hypothetical protein PSQ19_07435 [Devosia algicola]